MCVLGQHPVEAKQCQMASQSIPVVNQIRAITASFDATETSDMANAGCCVVDKVRALSSSSVTDKEQSILLFLTGFYLKVFSSEKMITRLAEADLTSSTTPLQLSRCLCPALDRNFNSIESLCSHFEIPNNNNPLSSMSQ